MFSGSSNVDTLASGKDVVNVKLPPVSSTEGMEFEDHDKDPSNLPESKVLSGFHISSEQIPDLITLSLLPRSQWQSLINLDIIKVIFLIVDSHHHSQTKGKKKEKKERVKKVKNIIYVLMPFSCSRIFNFQVRNKPIEPPKKPEKAPFFLPSLPSLSGEILFKPSESAKTESMEKGVDNEQQKKSDITSSQFLQLLESSSETKNCKSTQCLHFLFL